MTELLKERFEAIEIDRLVEVLEENAREIEYMEATENVAAGGRDMETLVFELVEILREEGAEGG